MSKTAQKIIIFIWLTATAFLSLAALFLTWNGDIFRFLAVNDPLGFKTIVYTFFGGALGSIVYAFRGFYQSIAVSGNSPKAFHFKWIFWYLLRPLAGGIFGFVVYAFARSELVAFGLTAKPPEQNSLMFFALSFLAGFGFHDFAEYLKTKVKKVFNNKPND